MIGRLWNRHLAAHRSRQYEIDAAEEASAHYQDLRQRLENGEHLTLDQEHELNRLIVAWARANAFNHTMKHWTVWHWFHGPDYPADMQWVDKFADDIDPSLF